MGKEKLKFNCKYRVASHENMTDTSNLQKYVFETFTKKLNSFRNNRRSNRPHHLRFMGIIGGSLESP